MLTKLKNICAGGKPHWDTYEKRLYVASVPAHSGDDALIDKYYGKLTISLKINKKRVLVKGHLKADFDDSAEFGLWVRWYFVPTPNSLNKLLENLPKAYPEG